MRAQRHNWVVPAPLLWRCSRCLPQKATGTTLPVRSLRTGQCPPDPVVDVIRAYGQRRITRVRSLLERVTANHRPARLPAWPGNNMRYNCTHLDPPDFHKRLRRPRISLPKHIIRQHPIQPRATPTFKLGRLGRLERM